MLETQSITHNHLVLWRIQFADRKIYEYAIFFFNTAGRRAELYVYIKSKKGIRKVKRKY